MKKYGYLLSDYQYRLDPGLIAQKPPARRGSSRLLVLDRESGKIIHDKFSGLVNYLRRGDCLVLNNTRVIPARVYGFTEKTKAKIEILLLESTGRYGWDVMMRNSRRVNPGDKVSFPEGIKLTVRKKTGKVVKVDFNMAKTSLLKKLSKAGVMPLPPYIKEDIFNPLHKRRYQTVFAGKDGAKAAPTAGLHFTGSMLKKIRKKGIKTVFITLHVGYGTFEEISCTDIREHRIHSEYFRVDAAAVSAVNRALSNNRRVIAAGTTSLRAIESAAVKNRLYTKKGMTSAYIFPGYKFRVTGGLITNFHLPRTTLLALVYAFGGPGKVKKAYKEALNRRYRLFSYGDAMLII